MADGRKGRLEVGGKYPQLQTSLQARRIPSIISEFTTGEVDLCLTFLYHFLGCAGIGGRGGKQPEATQSRVVLYLLFLAKAALLNERIKIKYDEFLASIDFPALSEAEKRIHVVVASNFDALCDLDRHNSTRTKKIIELYRSSLVNETEIVAPSPLANGPANSAITSLNTLAVQHFRGFGVTGHNFDLSRQLTLFFGRNGAGKSSVTDALEYCLLGSITEAESRRLSLEDYVRNRRTGKSVPPKLTAATAQQPDWIVEPDASRYNFAFIERNRIEEFARIAAKTPKDLEAALSVLFGLSEFGEFVRECADNIGERERLELINGTKKNLETKQNAFKEIKTDYDSSKGRLHDECLKRSKLLVDAGSHRLVVSSGVVATFDSTIAYSKAPNMVEQNSLIYVDNESGHRISRYSSQDEFCFQKLYALLKDQSSATSPFTLLQNEINAASKKAVEFSTSEQFVEALRSAFDAIEKFEKAKKVFVELGSRVNFKMLFEIATTLDQAADRCPLCETPLSGENHVAKNPFENAKTRLLELQDVVIAQEQQTQSWTTLQLVCDALRKHCQSWEGLAKEVADGGYAMPLFPAPPTEIGDPKYADWVKSVYSGYELAKEKLALFMEKGRLRNAEVTATAGKLTELKEEQTKLNKFRDDALALGLAIDDRKNQLELQTDRFVTANRELKTLERQSAEAEARIAENQLLVNGYRSFRTQLQKFYTETVIASSKNLNELVKEFYNALNYTDFPEDLIESISFPTRSGERIIASFNDARLKNVDPLVFLSEGHIRCLGLAILLAKAVSDDLPFVVLDDVVTSIDTQHRSHFISLLVNDPRLNSRQRVVTSHGNEFMKVLENEHSLAAAATEVLRINLRKRRCDEIEKTEETHHYLLRAREYLETSESRDSLDECRSALENLSEKLVKMVAADSGEAVSVKVRSLTLRPELMSQVEGVLSAIRKKKLTAEKYNVIAPNLEKLSGLKNSHGLYWQYLNEGTHESSSREEFDPTIVKVIVDALVEIDEALKAKKPLASQVSVVRNPQNAPNPEEGPVADHAVRSLATAEETSTPDVSE